MAYTDEYGTQFSDDKKRLIKFTSEAKECFIPSGTEEIAANAFKDNKSLKVLHLPSTVKLVQHNAFYECNIDEIHFSGDIEQWLQITWKSLFSKSYRLFFNETELVESIIIPESISVIKECAFYYCNSLRSVIFNKHITSIENSAFNKSNLKGILSIPKSCRIIKANAFFNCNEITKVKIPDATEEIWYGAFSACAKLQEFVVSAGNNYFFTDGIGLYSFVKESNTKSVNKNKLKLVALASGSEKSYCLHDHTVSIIQDACCYDSIPGKELTIPHVVSLVKDAFRSCRGSVEAPLKMKKMILDQGVPNNKYKALFVLNDALISQETPKVISLNPFRVLGVYCNASQREIQSNAAKIKRFLEIGKQPTFKTDYNEVFPSLERTQEMVDEALSQISQPKEKLAYAMQWFAKPCCEQHQKAEDLLRNNKVDEACEMMIHNCGDVRYMLGPYMSLARQRLDNHFNLISYAFIVYPYLRAKKSTDKNGEEIIHEKSLLEEICGENFSITEDECQILLFDKLMTFINPIHLWTCAISYHFSNSVIEHLFSKSIGVNISNINTKIAAIKNLDTKDSAVKLKAAKNLKTNTEQDILTIDEYLSPVDVRYKSIHDTLAKEILQNAIDSYNNAKNHTGVAREVYELMEYAGKIAKGDLTKSRCEENVKVVKEVVDGLPPVGLESEDKELFAAVTRARNSEDTIERAVALLKEVEPNLYIINLQKHSEKDANVVNQIQTYFTKVCTIIANVCLNKIIEDINNSSIDVEKNYKAFRILQNINQLPLEAEFKKKRYDKNADILIENCSGGFLSLNFMKNGVSYDIIDIRPESIVWEQCCKDKDYTHYIVRFPSGNHIKEARQLQNEIVKKKEEQRKRQKEQREQRKRKERERKRKEEEEQEKEYKRLEEETRRIEQIRREEEKEMQQKIKREDDILDWIICILFIFIAIEIVYLLWGWKGVTTSLIIIAILAAMCLIGTIVEYFEKKS